jgi:hypothetical protein
LTRKITISGNYPRNTDSDFGVTGFTELNSISNNEQNDDFSPSGLSFLDFTEDNPFGDPEFN